MDDSTIHTKNCNHTQYTFGVEYKGFDKKGIKWKEFHNMFTEMGGDGFYSSWKNPYLEPALKGKNLEIQYVKKVYVLLLRISKKK